MPHQSDMNVKTIKLGRGHYRLEREDGYQIEVRSSNKGDWYNVSNMARNRSLGAFIFDMKRGYTSHDILLKKEKAGESNAKKDEI